jgi:lipopolysaccharide cholinephosphotransferase
MQLSNKNIRVNYMMTKETINRIQQIEFDIMQQIDSICRAHNLTYFAIGGSVLGAVRHQGFIPWDDDIDIVMLRKDFRRLEKILHKMKSDEFIYQSMLSDIDYVNTFGKFRKRKGEVKITRGRYRYLKYKGQFIDIFAIERTPYWAARAARVIYFNMQYPTIYIKTKWLRHILIRLIEGLCLGIINPVLRLLGLINPKGEYHYQMGTGWARHTFYLKDTFPLSTIEFEGHEFPAPRDVDAYLTNVYGDWRKLPDEEAIRQSIHSMEYVDEIYGE